MSIPMMTINQLLIALALSLFGALDAFAQSVTRAEVTRVRYELSKVEQKLKDASGLPIELSQYDLKAFDLVKEISQKDPENPDVIQLVEEAKGFYNRAKGNRLEITEEMVAYRRKQGDLVQAIGEQADRSWNEMADTLSRSNEFIPQPFPVQISPDINLDSVVNKSVILPQVDWESALFVQLGGNWLAAGDEAQGYYFIDGSCPEYNQLYAAIQRYRDQIKNQISSQWTIAGVIEGPAMLAPQCTNERAGTPSIGWRVRPTAIHIPGCVTAMLDTDSQNSARFIGEELLSQLRQYSVVNIPEQVEPADLIEIFIVALKEKNWDLHLECIEPSLRSHPGQIQSLKYNWDVQQKGLENYHCHAMPTHVSEIKTTQGNVNQDLEDFFGDGVNRSPARAMNERVVVSVALFTEQGIQSVRPRYVTLERKNQGRWYIVSGMTLTF